MNKMDRKYQTFEALARYGVSQADAVRLRRIQMTLHRWDELECGIDGRAIERDEKTGRPYLTYESGNGGKRARHRIADRENGALKRLAIINEKPTLRSSPTIRATVGAARSTSSSGATSPQAGSWNPITRVALR